MSQSCSLVGLEKENVLSKEIAQTQVSRHRKHFLKERKFYQLDFGSILVSDPQSTVIREISNDCYEIFCKQCGFGYRIFLQNGYAVGQKLHYKSPEKKTGTTLTQACPFQIRGLIKLVDVKQNHQNNEGADKNEWPQANNTVALLMCYANKQILSQALDFPLYLE